MTREEAIKIIQNEYKCVDRECDIEKSCGKCPYMMPSKEPILQAYEMAIQALSQEPTDDATLKDIFCMGCEYKEQEPCTDTVSIRKDILKCRVGKIVAYNVEWLKKHWQMEMDIVCGVKPCDDAISRQAVLDLLEDTNNGWIINEVVQLPSVTQKSGKWTTVTNGRGGHECSLCHEYAPSYQDGDEWLTKYCPNCGAKMESEDKE